MKVVVYVEIYYILSPTWQALINLKLNTLTDGRPPTFIQRYRQLNGPQFSFQLQQFTHWRYIWVVISFTKPNYTFENFISIKISFYRLLEMIRMFISSHMKTVLISFIFIDRSYISSYQKYFKCTTIKNAINFNNLY